MIYFIQNLYTTLQVSRTPNPRTTFGMEAQWLTGKKSIIRQVFCERSAQNCVLLNRNRDALSQQTVLRPAVHIRLIPVLSGNAGQHYELLVTGQVTGTPAYLNIQVFRRIDSKCLLHHDYLVLDSTARQLTINNRETVERFDIRYTWNSKQLNSKNSGNYQHVDHPLLLVRLRDCQASRAFSVFPEYNRPPTYKDSLFLNHSRQEINQLNLTTKMEHQRWVIYLPLLITSSVIATFYLLFLVVYGLVRSCLLTNRKYLINVSSQTQDATHPTISRQILLIPQPFPSFERECLYTGRTICTENILPLTQPVYYHPAVSPRDDQDRSVRHSTKTQTWSLKASSYRIPHTTSRRILLFSNLAFRVFYTFLFTFSVAVSLIFSLQPSPKLNVSHILLQKPPIIAYPQTNAPHGWPTGLLTNQLRVSKTQSKSQRSVGPTVRLRSEAQWLETFADQELRRQLDYVDRMKVACHHAVGVEISDAVREMRQLVQERLNNWRGSKSAEDRTRSGEQRECVLSASLELTRYHFAAQRELLAQVQSQMEKQLDFRFTEMYRAFYELLERSYQSGWLRYVQRMLNDSYRTDSHLDLTEQRYFNEFTLTHSSTQFDVARLRGGLQGRYASAEQTSGLEHTHVTLLTFMGFHQAESVHFLPVQLLQELKRVFLANQYRPLLPVPEETTQEHAVNELLLAYESSPILSKYLSGSTVERVFFSSGDSEVDDQLIFLNSKLIQNKGDSTARRDINFMSFNGQNRKANQQRYQLQPVALSLTELRLILLLIDCFIIVYRFYHTYLTLRDIWFGQRLYVDAACVVAASSDVVSKCNTFPVEKMEAMLQAADTPNNRLKIEKMKVLKRLPQGCSEMNSSMSKAELLNDMVAEPSRYACSHRTIDSPVGYMCTPETSAGEKNLTSDQSSNRPERIRSPNHECCSTISPCSDSVQSGCVRPQATFAALSPPVHLPRNFPLNYDGLLLPPSSSFGSEQSVSCLLGIRATCCRHSHYISAVVGLAVILALFGLLLNQEQRVLTQVTDSKRHIQTNTHTRVVAQVPRGVVHPLEFARRYYDNVIGKQAKRLNTEWLLWTQSKEMAMRRRLLSYTSRFRHDFNFFDRQVRAEASLMVKAMQEFLRSTPTSVTGKNPDSWNNSLSSGSQVLPPKLNSEMLFRQQICHFLPVVPVQLSTSFQTMTDSAWNVHPNLEYRKMSVHNLLWTALISRAMDSDWNSLQQARHLTITALLVAVTMIGCVGLVNICGWMFRMRFLNPFDTLTKTVQPDEVCVSKSLNHSKIINTDNVVLIAPQPPPIIPLPSRQESLKANHRDSHDTVHASLHDSHVHQMSCGTTHAYDATEMGIPLTTLYVNSGLVLSPSTIRSLPIHPAHHTVPMLIAHQPNSTSIMLNTTRTT
ncbi:hypothetical protein EG68_00496 [Paragonimus skrjabini miyazakii]|uniref:Uncharacterized protein n=1 Tax=Paragonimus skrjabini miyazakii TaxID=59628 RepID=A0A8S9Z5P9_9TREM|nr:hypothetical protein EG68_00496 [Paragonimus skrjabini miyazakii]